VSQVSLQAVLSSINPIRVQEVVCRLAAIDGAKREIGVSMTTLLDEFIGDAELGRGAERWRALLQIKSAITDALSDVPGMRYVAGDA